MTLDKLTKRIRHNTDAGMSGVCSWPVLAVFIAILALLPCLAFGQQWTWPGDLRGHMRKHGVTNADSIPTGQLIEHHNQIHNGKVATGHPNIHTPDSTDAAQFLTVQCPGGICPIGPMRPQSQPPIRVSPTPSTSNSRQWAPLDGAVVRIRSRYDGQTISMGNACLTRAGYTPLILTCCHLSQEGTTYEISRDGQQWYEAELLYANPADDVMLLRESVDMGDARTRRR